MSKPKLEDLLAETEESQEVQIVQDQREKLILQWTDDPWAFLTGRDVDGRPTYWTKDQGSTQPVKPFPDWPYLREYIHILQSELRLAGEARKARTVLADKPRQVLLTTAVMAFASWNCLFHRARRWLLSKHSEDEAKEILRDKVRFPIEQMPAWLRERAGPGQWWKQPAVRVNYPTQDSTILAVGENAAEAEARGGTSTGTIIDEAAFQSATGEIVDGARPQTSLLALLTTPNLGNPGAEAFMDMMEHEHPEHTKPAKEYHPPHGMEVLRTRKRYVVIHLDWWCRPDRDEAWAKAQQEEARSAVKFRREYGRSWETSSGDAYYPEIRDRPERFIRRAPGLIDAPLVRGFDLGRHPAICVFQYSTKQDRVWVLRELSPKGIGTHEFAVLSRWLCGEIPDSEVANYPRASELAMELKSRAAEGKGPPVPWFEHDAAKPLTFLNYAGHEANMANALGVSGESHEEVFAAAGIRLSVQYTQIKARAHIIRRLIWDRPDGEPGLLIDPSCPLIARGLAGGIVYNTPTKNRPDPDVPHPEDTYGHLHDALGYGLVNYVPVAKALQSQAQVVQVGRSFVRVPASEGLWLSDLDRSY